MPYGFFPEMPQNRTYSFSVLFRKNEHKKWGISRKKARDRFENEKRTENEYIRFWGISGKNAYALT